MRRVWMVAVGFTAAGWIQAGSSVLPALAYSRAIRRNLQPTHILIL